MKNSPLTFICILMCLLPTHMAAQAPQEQNPKFRSPILLGDTYLTTRQMTEDPLLRLSRTGPMGNGGILLDLTQLPLLEPGPSFGIRADDPDAPYLGTLSMMPNPGGPELRMRALEDPNQDIFIIDLGELVVPPYRPRIELRKPLVGGIQSAIFVEPSEDRPYLRYTSFGASGLRQNIGHAPTLNSFFDVFIDINEGLEIHAFSDPLLDLVVERTYDKATPKLLERIYSNNSGVNSFFDVFYDLPLGTETRSYGDPDFDLLVTRTYDKATPKLLERISSGNAGVDSFFDIFYDLDLGKETRLYGDPDFDLLVTRTYDKATPKLLERISSGNAGVDSFFDIFYDLDLGKETRLYGDPDFDLLVTRTYDKATPKLLERISSGNAGMESFFDVFYDLSFATIGMGFGQNPNNICYTHHFDPNQPSLRSKIESSDPQYLNSFFDITYDLDLGSITTKHQGFKHVVQYNESDWDFISRYASDDPLIPDFFDISYDLSLGKQRTRFNNQFFTVTSSEPSTICWRFASDLPGITDAFDVCYDFGVHEIQTEIVAMNLVSSFDPVDVRQRTRFTSDDPTIQGFMDVAMDISNQDLVVHSTRAGVTGLPSMEMKYEYDGLDRLIREVAVDESSGATLALIRRLSPGGTGLSVGGSLWVEGPLSSESGPLLLADDTQLNGFLTVVGGLQVNGPKMFRIDHPLDPANKYLQHSCVESPDMMNVYNGNALTDEMGFVTIGLPDYFEALNSDFRYQLTCIGQFAQAIVAEKIAGNRFTIQTDKPHVEVSWQVTGIRKDPAALSSGYAVEVMK